MAISATLSDMWTATGFSDSELAAYAERRVLADTRLGIQLVTLLCLFAQIVVALTAIGDSGILSPGGASDITRTSATLGALSLHIAASSAFVSDVRSLHLLGMAYFIISALAVAFLAHQLGDLNAGMMATLVLLIVSVPLIPWSLRESVIVIGLVYLMLTASLLGMRDRFDTDSLQVLQLLMLGAAIVAAVLTGRSTLVRKHDLRARYELERAHDRLERLSLQDHLTGAWNRRYLEANFATFVEECRRRGRPLQNAILDIDDFKGINDDFGHATGDRILTEISAVLIKHLGDDGCLVRLGGDEFQIVYSGSNLENLISAAVDEVQQSRVARDLADHREITLSAGIVTIDNLNGVDLEDIYRRADKALYSAKVADETSKQVVLDGFSRTGTWPL